MWTASSGFGPDVRKRQIPGVMPVALPSETAMRARPRPRSAIVVPKETKHQQFILYGMQRSSDLIGAPESNVPVADTAAEEPDPTKMNYQAQFLYNDWRVKPIGGLKRKTTSSDILNAVSWQKKQVERAYNLSSWESRLGTSTKNLGDAYAAQRIKEKQRLADLRVRKSAHSLTGTEMIGENFDNVYSEEHAHKDTISALGDGLLPTVDTRCTITRPKGITYGAIHKVKTCMGERPMLPTRSFMAIGEGPGRSIDF